jgi:hypothetical protein
MRFKGSPYAFAIMARGRRERLNRPDPMKMQERMQTIRLACPG